MVASGGGIIEGEAVIVGRIDCITADGCGA
jgi:hypothetical protein